MSLEKFMKNALSEWMRVKGPQSEIVFSSRVRIARNLSNIPFPLLSTASQAEEVVQTVENSWKKEKRKALLKNAELVRLNELSELEKMVLVEKHLISPLLAEESRHGAVLLNQDESISIMLNEEDHLRIQCLFPGMQLEETWKLACKIDDLFEKNINYAFDEQCGFLTSCPTNVGTGIRASVMVHLPAMAMTQRLNRLISAITQVGLAVRGIYGEGSEALGHLYQVSNQVTLGQSEEEVIEKLQGVVSQIIEHEHMARQKLQDSSLLQLEDRVHRSLGVLSYARILNTNEAMKHLSEVRLGVDLGLIHGVSAGVMNELMVMIQPGFLQQYAGKRLDAEQRDYRRAILIRERLAMEGKDEQEI